MVGIVWGRMSKFPLRDLFIIIVIAVVARVLLLASNAVSFHSDEAVVALMARHINQGARPVFFYGQAYMGSLDAWLVSFGFRLFGESVLSIRIVQSLLYVLIVATSYLAAWEFSHKRLIAAVSGLTFALASVLVATYTTATLGGYNEVLLLGNIILIAGFRVINRSEARWGWWALLGVCTGLGWWANGLIVMYVIPVGLLGLVELFRRVRLQQEITPYLGGIAVAAILFFVGSAPWWIYDFTHNHEALNFYTTGTISESVTENTTRPTFGTRVLGLVLFGLPALVGARFSWLSEYFLLPVGLLVIAIYLMGLYRLIRVDPLRPGARPLVLTMIVVFLLIFLASPFSADPTGRYFLPLVFPISIALGTLADGLLHAEKLNPALRRLLPAGVLIIVLGYQLAGQIAAINGAYGLTTQFDLITHIPHEYDDELIAFLEENALYHGHTNYWVAYRMAFLSGETLQYSASLPYKEDLSYNAADQRYTPYTEATEAAEEVAYITTHLPALDEQLEARFDEQGLSYRLETIGPYNIYYDFAPQ